MHIQLSYIKHRPYAQMLLICVIMECPTLMEEQSVPLRKSGLLKCHSCFRGLSFKRRFQPSIFHLSFLFFFILYSPFFALLFSIIHPVSFCPQSFEDRNMHFLIQGQVMEINSTAAIKGFMAHLTMWKNNVRRSMRGCQTKQLPSSLANGTLQPGRGWRHVVHFSVYFSVVCGFP